MNRLIDSGVSRLSDTSAFVNTAGQLLLTRRGKTRMDGVGIVFEFYTAPLYLPMLNGFVFYFYARHMLIFKSQSVSDIFNTYSRLSASGADHGATR